MREDVYTAGNGCLNGGTDCGKGCTNLDVDPVNCGECGNACADDPTCVDGVVCIQGGCVCGGGSIGCPAGLMQCGDLCFDEDSDAANCAECGNTCGAGDACDAGGCVL